LKNIQKEIQKDFYNKEEEHKFLNKFNEKKGSI
jgi:hypothetical protein